MSLKAPPELVRSIVSELYDEQLHKQDVIEQGTAKLLRDRSLKTHLPAIIQWAVDTATTP